VPRAAETLLAIALACCACVPSTTRAASRHAVTFILGTDAGERGFFAGAAAYYRMHAQAHDETVALRSLADVREYLAKASMRGDEPWGTIRLVAHGSEWYGLRVPIFFDGKGGEATLAALEHAASNGTFPPLTHAAFDARTQLLIESCGIARRPRLEHAIAALLFGDDAQPRVSASRDYVAFRAWTDADGIEHAERAELPYVSLVTRADTQVHATVERLRVEMAREWAAQNLRTAPTDFVLHDIPIEIRNASISATPGARPAEATRATLYDLGLRHDQLRWSREGDAQVGRAHILTLMPAGEDGFMLEP
jgi:hypothetical protein